MKLTNERSLCTGTTTTTISIVLASCLSEIPDRICLPARERLLGILAGTGLWYSNIADGEQSYINEVDEDNVA